MGYLRSPGRCLPLSLMPPTPAVRLPQSEQRPDHLIRARGGRPRPSTHQTALPSGAPPSSRGHADGGGPWQGTQVPPPRTPSRRPGHPPDTEDLSEGAQFGDKGRALRTNARGCGRPGARRARGGAGEGPGLHMPPLPGRRSSPSEVCWAIVRGTQDVSHTRWPCAVQVGYRGAE